MSTGPNPVFYTCRSILYGSWSSTIHNAALWSNLRRQSIRSYEQYGPCNVHNNNQIVVPFDLIHQPFMISVTKRQTYFQSIADKETGSRNYQISLWWYEIQCADIELYLFPSPQSRKKQVTKQTVKKTSCCLWCNQMFSHFEVFLLKISQTLIRKARASHITSDVNSRKFWLNYT